jgi:hypothetical protein
VDDKPQQQQQQQQHVESDGKPDGAGAPATSRGAADAGAAQSEAATPSTAMEVGCQHSASQDRESLIAHCWVT